MEIHLIAAVDDARGIGFNGDLPWPKLKEDMKRFRKLTTGWPVIMGRKTWESIPERFRPLPNRINIVLSSGGEVDLWEEYTVHSCWENALESLAHWDKVYIIGGASLYKEFLDGDIVHQMEITHVKSQFEADTFFPEINEEDWDKSWSDFATTKEGLEYEFWTYRRRVRTNT